MEQIIRPLQTLANVVSALRESDYSFRARGARQLDALGELALEINEFADLLQSQRLGELEASALLRCVISSMDAPVLAFDPSASPPSCQSCCRAHLPSHSGTGLGLRALMICNSPTCWISLIGESLSLAAKAIPVHWMVRRSSFRQHGIPHTLLVLSDVSIALREQERDAFQRLIRVIGHEINNSLTPIKSIAGSLRSWIHLIRCSDTLRIRPVQIMTYSASTVVSKLLRIVLNRSIDSSRHTGSWRSYRRLHCNRCRCIH